jgi:uncharacterized protein YbaR (Trm112 family)
VFIELVDVLRCPNRHDETWLVLSADRMDGRDVMRGTLGCPICHAEFPIVAGVARFGDRPPARAHPRNDAESLRLAALLDLTEAGGYAILAGETGNQAPGMRELTDTQLLLVDPPTDVEMGNGLSGLTTPSTPRAFPLADGSARAIALDEAATAEQLDAAVRALSPAGRLLAPVRLPLPDHITELARDDRSWLAAKTREAHSSRIVNIDRHRPGMR